MLRVRGKCAGWLGCGFCYWSRCRHYNKAGHNAMSNAKACRWYHVKAYNRLRPKNSPHWFLTFSAKFRPSGHLFRGRQISTKGESRTENGKDYTNIFFFFSFGREMIDVWRLGRHLKGFSGKCTGAKRKQKNRRFNYTGLLLRACVTWQWQE